MSYTGMVVVILIALVVGIAFLGIFYLFFLLIRALQKYIKSADVRKEKRAAKNSLGEAIKSHRIRCQMTQEFVADALGVSRQAVSKWENGGSLR